MRVLHVALAAAVAIASLFASPVRAVEAVNVRVDIAAIDLTDAVERLTTEGGRIQVSTAPGSDGIVRRIEVPAREAGTNWAVIALANSSDEQIDRLIVVPHYQMVGSKILWPDLGLSRVVNITPSAGDRPDRQDSATADIFRITLDPGTVITYIAELRTSKLPQVYLWEPDAYKDKVNSFTLYHGIVIGIAGLLALFLTILFVVKGSFMFPAAAALGWAVLVYIGVDFGFWGKVFDMSAGAERVWRASGEAILAATLLVFLFAYLNLNRWHVRYAHIAIAWLAFLGALVAVALVDPSIASGIARLSLLFVAIAGFGLVIYLAAQGFDRAVLLIPTWFLLVSWVVAAGLAVAGWVTNDIVAPALLGGLVLIVMLIGFTVMQHAFAGGITQGIVSDVERRALALTGAGDLIWDWDVSADKVFTSPETETMLGLKRGTLGRPGGAMGRRAPSARPRPFPRRARQRDRAAARPPGAGFPAAHARRAFAVVHHEGAAGGRLRRRGDPAGRHPDRRHRCQGRRGAPASRRRPRQSDRPAEPRSFSSTGSKRVLAFAKTNPDIRPTVMVMDLDRFKQVNDFGRHGGRGFDPADARAPARPPAQAAGHAGAAVRRPVRPHPDVGEGPQPHHRVRGNHLQGDPRADHLQRTRDLPHRLARHRAAGGAAEPRPRNCSRMPSSRCIVAKRSRGDRFEVFKPAMRARKTDRLTLESELRRALDREEITLLYQPIVRLEDRTVAGFEALARWDHPKMGRLSPSEFISIAEEIGLITDLGLFALERTARQLGIWQRAVRSRVPLFASVNVSSRQLLKQRSDRRPAHRAGALRADPRHAQARAHRIRRHGKSRAGGADPQRMRDLGAGLALDDFGTGHSSLVYLQRFPFDTIKIDQSFVRTNAKGTRPVILRSIVGLAHDLGMDVVAEGAETDSDAVELYHLGCEFAQGFAFGQPMTADQAHETAGGRSPRDGTVIAGVMLGTTADQACPASLDSMPT